MVARLAHLFANRRGAIAVEMAFALPMLVTLLIGTFEFGRLFWIRSTMQYAVEQTGRYAMAKPDSTLPALESYLRKHFPSLNTDGIALQLSNETVDGVKYVVILAKYEFSFIGLLPIPAVSLEGRSRVPVVI